MQGKPDDELPQLAVFQGMTADGTRVAQDTIYRSGESPRRLGSAATSRKMQARAWLPHRHARTPSPLPTPRIRPPAKALPPTLHSLPRRLRAALRLHLRQVPPPSHHPGRLRLSTLQRLEPGHRPHQVSGVRLRPLPPFLMQELPPMPLLCAQADPPCRRVPQRGPASHPAPPPGGAVARPRVRLDHSQGPSRLLPS
jgi:hypothetical protein